MTIDVFWGNEAKNIIVYQMDDQWTGQEWIDAVKRCNSMIDTITHNVDIIYDFTKAKGHFDVRGFLNNIKEASHLNRTDRADRVVVVGVSPVISTLVEIVPRTFRSNQRVEFKSSLADAFAYLESEPAARPSNSGQLVLKQPTEELYSKDTKPQKDVERIDLKSNETESNNNDPQYKTVI